MRLGGFGRIADYDNIRQAGFDYAELDVPEIEALTENEFRIFCDKVHEIGFPVLTGARALPVAKPCFLRILLTHWNIRLILSMLVIGRSYLGWTGLLLEMVRLVCS